MEEGSCGLTQHPSAVNRKGICYYLFLLSVGLESMDEEGPPVKHYRKVKSVLVFGFLLNHKSISTGDLS